MTGESSANLSKKAALIYEFNKNSPLFARIAYGKYLNGDLADAESILRKGLAAHPDYSSAYLILALTLAAQNKVGDAFDNLDRVGKLIDNPETLAYYKDKVRDLSNPDSNLGNSGLIDSQKIKQSFHTAVEPMPL